MQVFLSKQIGNTQRVQNFSQDSSEIIEGPEIKGLCPSVAAKIAAKERFYKSQKVDLVDSCVVKEHNQGERILKMIEILKVLFSTHKTPSMFWNSLVSKLMQLLNNKNNRIIEEDLTEIIKNFNSFISLIDTNSGPVVRINRQNDVKFVDLRQEIKNKYCLT